jgi:hypothetical protein
MKGAAVRLGEKLLIDKFSFLGLGKRRSRQLKSYFTSPITRLERELRRFMRSGQEFRIVYLREGASWLANLLIPVVLIIPQAPDPYPIWLNAFDTPE